MPLSFVGLLYFCFILKASVLIISLAIGLLIIDFTINKVESINKKIVINFFGWSW